MEYTNGLPLEDVGWGRFFTGSSVSTDTDRHAGIRYSSADTLSWPGAEFECRLACASFHGAGRHRHCHSAAPSGGPDTRTNVIISSDAYVVGLAGILGLHWQLPGYQPDFCPPGGALVFELRQARGLRKVSGSRVLHRTDVGSIAQSDAAYAGGAACQHPTPHSGRGGSGPSLDVKFERFRKLLKKAIDPEFVQDPAKEVPPGALTGVPLK